jgi:hypothetical protein
MKRICRGCSRPFETANAVAPTLLELLRNVEAG